MDNILIFIGVGLVVIVGAWFFLGQQEMATTAEPAPTPGQSSDAVTTTPVNDEANEGGAVEAFPSAVTENVVADIVQTTQYTAAEVTIDSVTDQTSGPMDVWG